MTRAAPPWLEDFQARFGAVLRAPLDRATGTLKAVESDYEAMMVESIVDGPTTTSAERLAVYNRQYWFRMFGVLHGAFPLTCRLIGYWAFNAYAALYLDAHPPRGWDLDSVGDGFFRFFKREIEHHDASERIAIVEAARIDAAFRDVFRAPPVTPFRPSAEDEAHLLDAILVVSPAVAIVSEHSALADLRRTIVRDDSERRVPFPPKWPEVRFIAIVRTDEGTGEIPLEAREAELLRLLAEHPVRAALGFLERACPEGERASLPAKTQNWLARSVQGGFWIGRR